MNRFVKIQLIIFTIASIVGVGAMIFQYMQVPTLLGVGHITVKLELPAAGGLYRFSNVTYRGVQVGKVTDIDVIGDKRVEATLSLDTSPKIPAALQAQIRSVSAVGEQFVDLLPHDDSPPYLRDGSVIVMQDTSIPQPVGPVLDRLNTLVSSIPQDRLGNLLDESFKAFNGAGYDFGSLLDSSATLTHDLSGVADRTRVLAEDSVPLLDGQAQSSDAIKVLAHSLAGVTDHLTQDDPQLRTILQKGPGFAQEVSQLLTQVKPTLPVLLANLTTIGQVGVTYHASLEQLLVLLPPNVANTQAASPLNNPTGLPLGDFALTVEDPPACTVGFLPPSSWRSPADTTEIDTPDGLYCKLPQDSPIAVRGARNYPCMDKPGKRAPTVELCDSDQPFEPIAQREHVLGPYQLDPNLVAQGVPPDTRAGRDANTFGPPEGTPRPGQTPPDGTASSDSPPAAIAPSDADAVPSPVQAPPVGGDSTPASGDVLPAPTGGSPAAAPSAFNATEAAGPSVAVAKYDPRTGKYMGPDGHIYRQMDLSTSGQARKWTDLVMGAL